MLHRSIRTRLALATGVAVLAGAGSAIAAPAPLDPGTDPVSYDIRVIDADGATVKRLACDWRGAPDADDSPCLAWASDLRPTVEAIQAAGGVASITRVVAPAHGVDATTRISERSDGTWLIRAVGQAEGRSLHRGMVCDIDARRCVNWDAAGARKASGKIRAAAAGLRKRR